jgi:hypothetical protein
MKTETFSEFLARDPPPDLQKLAEEFGGLGNVPADRLADYQKRLTEWRNRVRDRA